MALQAIYIKKNTLYDNHTDPIYIGLIKFYINIIYNFINNMIIFKVITANNMHQRKMLHINNLLSISMEVPCIRSYIYIYIYVVRLKDFSWFFHTHSQRQRLHT